MSPSTRAFFASVLACSAFVTGCASAPAVSIDSPLPARMSTTEPAPDPAIRMLPPRATAIPSAEMAAAVAMSMIGSPYRYGGTAPSGFDCSGLVYYAYRRAGRKVPRTTREQLAASSPIGWAEARAGDLLFFSVDSQVSHVGVYIEDGQFVHAPATGRTVVLADIDDDYWRAHFVQAGRLPP